MPASEVPTNLTLTRKERNTKYYRMIVIKERLDKRVVSCLHLLSFRIYLTQLIQKQLCFPPIHISRTMA